MKILGWTDEPYWAFGNPPPRCRLHGAAGSLLPSTSLLQTQRRGWRQRTWHFSTGAREASQIAFQRTLGAPIVRPS